MGEEGSPTRSKSSPRRRRKTRKLLPYVQQVRDKFRCHYPTAAGTRKWSQLFDTEEQAHQRGVLEREILKSPGKSCTLAKGIEMVRQDLDLAERSAGTRKWYENQFAALTKHWDPQNRLDLFGPEELEWFVRERRKAGVRMGTIKAHLRAFSRVYNVAQQRGVLVDNPVRKMPRLREDPKPPKRAVYRWHVALSFIDRCRQQDAMIADLLDLHLHTGIRRSEAARIDRDCYADGILTILSKGGRDYVRRLPVPKPLAELIERMFARQPASPWLLPGETEDQRSEYVHRTFTRAKRITGDFDLASHAFRRTFASELARQRVPRDVRAQLTSHARQGQSMLDLYTTVFDDDLRSAMEKLWVPHGPPPPATGAS